MSPSIAHPSSAQRQQAYRQVCALRKAARDLQLTCADGSDAETLAALTLARCDETCSEHGLRGWVTT